MKSGRNVKVISPYIHRVRVLVTSGCLLWIASFFGEAFQLQPFSTAGIFVSPIVTVFGIFFWFKHYRFTRGHSPRLQTITDNITTIGGRFSLKSEFLFGHILEFWTFCVLFWMVMVLIMSLTFTNSDAFQATKRYCKNNQEILAMTGEIEYYGVLMSGNISSYTADLSFTIVGKRGNFKARAALENSGGWVVKDVTLNNE